MNSEKKAASYEWQSEARLWIDHQGLVEGWEMPLKMTVSGAARLRELLGAAIQEHAKHACALAAGLPSSGVSS